MKLRYYLRGLGIGIIVTAIIMSFTRQPEKLTDAQIKLRALELGMVEESVLADLENKKEESNIPAFEDIVNVEAEEQETVEESSSESENDLQENKESTTEIEGDIQEVIEDTDEAEDVLDEDSVESGAESDSQGEDADQVFLEESGNEDIANSNSVEGEDSNSAPTVISRDEVVENYIVILVESGNGSEIVSRRLFEAGLVNSAVEYNRFLVENGYAKKIRVGNHEIPADATEEEMAQILCGMR